MNYLSWERFKIYNWKSDITAVFENLCVEYFLRKHKTSKDEVVIIDPNNPWIETHPINNWTLWIQAKFVDNIELFNKAIKDSLKAKKLATYSNLKEIIVISNISFSITARTKKPLITKIGGIKINYLNGISFLQELKKPEFFDLVYIFFSWANLWWFLTSQQPKYKSYHNNAFHKNLISIYKDNNKRKISVNGFMKEILWSKDIILFTWIPASGKSLLTTHYLHLLWQEYLKDKANYMPICINVSRRWWNSLISYINNLLEEFTIWKINSYKKIILFIDWLNEISKEKCELLISCIEEIAISYQNIEKIIISSRKWSLNNSLITFKYIHFTIISDYSFNIEEYVKVSFKNINKLPILDPKLDNFSNFIWWLSISHNFYDETNVISLDDLQTKINKWLQINDNNQINKITNFLCDVNIFQIINSENIIFSDQKLYEYFFINYIWKHFLLLLPQLRKLNFFYKNEITEPLIDKLNILFEDKDIWSIFIKNIFISKLLESSLSNSWRGFEFNELFFKSLLNINRFEIYINENENFKNIINNTTDPYIVYELYKLWYTNLAKALEQKIKNTRDEKSRARNERYNNHKNEPEHIKRQKFNEYGMENFYHNLSYLLINDFIKNPQKFKTISPSKNPNALKEYVKFLIHILKDWYNIQFNKIFTSIKNKKFLELFVLKITNIENIHLIKNLEQVNIDKILRLYSFKNIIENINENLEKKHINLSIILLVLYYKKYNYTKKYKIIESNIQKIIELIHQKYPLEEIGKYWSDTEEDIKILTIYSILEWNLYSLDPISDQYQENKQYTNHKNQVIIWYIKWFLNYINWIEDSSFINIYSLSLWLWEKIHKTNRETQNLYDILISSTLIYIINQNKNLDSVFFKTLTTKHWNKESIIYIIKKIIIQTQYKNFDTNISNFIIENLKTDLSFIDHYESLLISSYINWSKNHWNSLSMNYFEKAFNHMYIRYWWRKDYFLSNVSESIKEWCAVWYIAKEQIYPYCKRIIQIYNNLINHVDWKWVRHIPTTIYEIIWQYSPSDLTNIRKDFWEDNQGWYILIWEFNALLKRIENLDSIKDIFQDIKILESNYQYYNEINLLKSILFCRILNNNYYYNILEHINKRHRNEKILAIKDNFKETSLIFPSYTKIGQEIDNLNRSCLNKDVFIEDLQKLTTLWYFKVLEWSINDLSKIPDEYDYWNKEDPMQLDFTKIETYDNILDHYNNYDLWKLNAKDIKELIKKFIIHFGENYMERILNSNLFWSIWYYGYKFSEIFLLELYKSNKFKFKKIISEKTKNPNHYWSGYFDDINLITLILIEDKNENTFIKFIENLLDLTDLMSL